MFLEEDIGRFYLQYIPYTCKTLVSLKYPKYAHKAQQKSHVMSRGFSFVQCCCLLTDTKNGIRSSLEICIKVYIPWSLHTGGGVVEHEKTDKAEY